MVTFDYKNGAIEHVFAKLFKLLIYEYELKYLNHVMCANVSHFQVLG